MTSAQPQPLSPRAERTRQRILDAAGQCFVAHGYARTTVEEVASAAAVSKGLFYNYFHSKEDVLVDLIERSMDEWDAVCTVAVDLAEGDDASVFDLFSAMHHATLDYVRANPLIRALLGMESWLLIHARIGPAMRESMERLRAEVRELVQRGVDRGEVRDDVDPAQLTEVILIHHLSYVDFTMAPEWVDASAPGCVDLGLDILFRGIARPS